MISNSKHLGVYPEPILDSLRKSYLLLSFFHISNPVICILIQIKFLSSIGLPDRVSTVTFSNITSTSTIISWNDNSWKKNPFNYIIDCFGCPKRNIFPIETEKSSVIIKKLNASTIYKISVAVNNSITVLTDELLFETAELHTKVGGR